MVPIPESDSGFLQLFLIFSWKNYKKSTSDFFFKVEDDLHALKRNFNTETISLWNISCLKSHILKMSQWFKSVKCLGTAFACLNFNWCFFLVCEWVCVWGLIASSGSLVSGRKRFFIIHQSCWRLAGRSCASAAVITALNLNTISLTHNFPQSSCVCLACGGGFISQMGSEFLTS